MTHDMHHATGCAACGAANAPGWKQVLGIADLRIGPVTDRVIVGLRCCCAFSLKAKMDPVLRPH